MSKSPDKNIGSHVTKFTNVTPNSMAKFLVCAAASPVLLNILVVGFSVKAMFCRGFLLHLVTSAESETYVMGKSDVYAIM